MALRVSTTKTMLARQIIPGQERIAINTQSPLFKDMIRIAQLGIDATEKYQRSANYSSLMDVLKDFADVIYDAMNVPFTDAVFKHTGIKLRKFVIPTDMYAAYPSAYCATFYRPVLATNSKKWLDIRSVASYGGTPTWGEYERIRAAANGKIDTIAGAFDPSINNAFIWDVGVTPGLFLSGRVHLDPQGRRDSVYTRVSITAEEIASILLHELGHGFYMVADVLDSVKRNDALADVYRDGVVSAIQKKQVTVDKDIPKSRVTGYLTLNNAMIENFLKLHSAAFTAFLTAKIKQRIDWFNIIGSFKSTPRLFIVIGLLIFMITVVPKMIRMGCSGGHITEAIAAITGTQRKRGETVLTGRQGQRIEEIADSFATRHGAGSTLMLALSKLHQNLQVKNSTIIAIKQMTDTTAILAKMSSYIDLTRKVQPEAAVSTYPETINRFYFILQEQVRVLKTMERTDDTADMIDQLVVGMRVMRELMDQVSNDPVFKNMRATATMMGDENTRDTIIGGIMTGNLTSDYRRMQDALNELSSNDAYFNAEDFMTK